MQIMKTLSDHITECLDDSNDMTIDNNAHVSKHVTESVLVNEGLEDFISELTTEQVTFLLGVVGAAGIMLSAKTYEKVVEKLKKSSNPLSKKIIDKLEEWGSAAASASK